MTKRCKMGTRCINGRCVVTYSKTTAQAKKECKDAFSKERKAMDKFGWDTPQHKKALLRSNKKCNEYEQRRMIDKWNEYEKNVVSR